MSQEQLTSATTSAVQLPDGEESQETPLYEHVISAAWERFNCEAREIAEKYYLVRIDQDEFTEEEILDLFYPFILPIAYDLRYSELARTTLENTMSETYSEGIFKDLLARFYTLATLNDRDDPIISSVLGLGEVPRFERIIRIDIIHGALERYLAEQELPEEIEVIVEIINAVLQSDSDSIGKSLDFIQQVLTTAYEEFCLNLLSTTLSAIEAFRTNDSITLSKLGIIPRHNDSPKRRLLQLVMRLQLFRPEMIDQLKPPFSTN